MNIEANTEEASMEEKETARRAGRKTRDSVFGTVEGTLFFFETLLLVVASISGICLLVLQLM